MLNKATKEKIAQDNQTHPTDTGSAQVQIALLSEEITHLTEHLKTNKKDNHSRRGLLKKVSQRRNLLGYISKKDPEAYAALIKKLGLKR